MRSPHSQAGFTIVHVIILLALGVIGAYGWRVHEQRKERAATLASLEKAAARIRDHLETSLNDDRAWNYTRLARQNSRMACLQSHASCEGKAGLIAVQDALNRVVYDSTLPTSGYTADGGTCTGFSEQGSDACPFRFEVVWEPLCANGCADPKTSNILGSLRFRPGAKYDLPFTAGNYAFHVTRETFPTEPKSCDAAYKDGSRRDGVQGIRPVPGGPVIFVYCDQNRDGGGWTLVANAAEDGAPDIPVAQTVTPRSSGRLPTAMIGQVIAASDHQGENNVRVLLPDIDRGLTIAMGTNGATEPAHFTAAMPAGECTAMPDKPNFASKSYDGEFNLTFKGGGEVTYRSKYVAGQATPGIDICFGVRPDGRDCGVGCKSVWRGVKEKLRGSVWIR